MNKSSLSNYFAGVAAKKLSAVEANPDVSNQHELNGVTELKAIFGDKKMENLSASFFYLDDKEENVRKTEGFLTWYDARENHPTRSEFRLYYSGKEVSEMFKEGDLVVIGKRTDGRFFFLAARNETTAANQLLWLFNLKDKDLEKFHFKDIAREDQELGFAASMILDELGIELETDSGLLDAMLIKFGKEFPATREFSEYTRDSLKGVIVQDDPDGALVAWMHHEEKLFKTFEKCIVAERLKEGFGSNGENVDAFISFSLSVQNRRKARVGAALENHLECIFKTLGISYSRGKVTENKSKPDFIFPSIEDYKTFNFPADRLTMLGAKSTCKDRWRQVLSEAKRIIEKHLLTLEPSISEAQTDEMKDSGLQLVVPKLIHNTYNAGQQKWLMSLSEFIKLVQSRES